MSAIFRSCLGYANCPGWAFIQRSVRDHFGGFAGLRSIELGSGEGKVSILFSLLGANTTLVDYNAEQLRRAARIAENFEVEPMIAQADLLHLPRNFWGKYDVSMSFGTAEHFFDSERQSVFDVHANALTKGGMSIIGVPNRYGLLLHMGVMARKLLRKKVCPIDEIPFSRKELFRRAEQAGLNNIRIVGGELLKNDFGNFIIDVPRILNLSASLKVFADAPSARDELLQCMATNDNLIRFWNNHFSYLLIIIGTSS